MELIDERDEAAPQQEANSFHSLLNQIKESLLSLFDGREEKFNFSFYSSSLLGGFQPAEEKSLIVEVE